MPTLENQPSSHAVDEVHVVSLPLLIQESHLEVICNTSSLPWNLYREQNLGFTLAVLTSCLLLPFLSRKASSGIL